LAELEQVAASFTPAEPMRDLTREELIEVYSVIAAATRGGFAEWLRERGLGDFVEILVEESVNPVE